ncbi:MAG: hypothetical protein R3Y35_12640, partial [Clostridia bacterium]
FMEKEFEMLVRYKKNGHPHLYDTHNIPIQMQATEEEISKPFVSCGKCNYASHGFLCFKEEGDCLKTALEKSQKKQNDFKGEKI